MHTSSHQTRIYQTKIITLEEAREHIRNGYFALDPHCHSSYSFDVPDAKETSPESVTRTQKILGLRNIISDHDTLNGYNHLKKKGYTKIIPGVELTFRPLIARKIDIKKSMHTLHINIFGLNNNDLAILGDIAKTGNLDELVKYMRQNDLEWMYNHPLWHANHEHLNWKVIPGLAKNYFDVIELNGSFSKYMNDIALGIAQNLNKGIIASSDSHSGNPGTGFVLAEGKNFHDFWSNVKEGNMYIVRRDMSTLNVVRESSMMINQAFNARTRSIDGKKYIPSTNVKPFDIIVKSVTSGKLKNKFITKKVIQMLMQSVNYSAGPILAWRLHTIKDEKKADHLRYKIESLTRKIKQIEANIKRIEHPRKNPEVIRIEKYTTRK